MAALPELAGRPLFLVGMMGTGKSTVGRLLAARLERPFVDLDERIEARAASTIAEIFAAEGEAGFRKREAAELADVAGAGPQVVAVGGGAPSFGDNLDRLLNAGLVVALTATVEELQARLGSGAGRPLLSESRDRSATLKALLEKRAPFYARAHLTVDTSNVPPSQVVAQILDALGAKP